MKVVLLGCGGSDGVPRIGGPDGAGDWGDCDPSNPRNRRTRSSLYVADDDGHGILIDTAPDLWGQLLDNRISRVDSVIYTHDHADHSHGINELRRLGAILGKRPDIYADPQTLANLRGRFDYAFEQKPGSLYSAIAQAHQVSGLFRLSNGRSVVSFFQSHGGSAYTLGVRIGDVAYSTDAVALDEAAFDALDGVRLWFVDCVRYRPHPTHSHFEQTLGWIERVRPEHAVLIHMNHDLDYETLRRECPPGVEPGYDGMTFDV